MREFAKWSASQANIEAAFKAYLESAEKQTKDPEDGPNKPGVAASLEMHEVLLMKVTGTGRVVLSGIYSDFMLHAAPWSWTKWSRC